MDSKDRKRVKGEEWTRVKNSFRAAFSGVKYALSLERHIRVHVTAAAAVIALAVILNVPLGHFLILLVVIGMVIALELVNTAIERVVDLVTKEFHPLAAKAKDTAAGAVLVVSIIAALIGVLVFYRPILNLFS